MVQLETCSLFSSTETLFWEKKIQSRNQAIVWVVLWLLVILTTLGRIYGYFKTVKKIWHLLISWLDIGIFLHKINSMLNGINRNSAVWNVTQYTVAPESIHPPMIIFFLLYCSI